MSTGELIRDEVATPTQKKGDAWKPTAYGATLAAVVFAGGIGWLAAERQRGQAQITALSGKLKSQLSAQEALQRRLYEQNRELALLNTRIRERDTRITQLLTKLTASEKATALAIKERDEWRTRASVRPSAPVLIVPTESVAKKPVEDPPRMTRRSSTSGPARRRRIRARRRPSETPAAVAETPRQKTLKSTLRSSSRKKGAEDAPRRKKRRARSEAKPRRRED